MKSDIKIEAFKNSPALDGYHCQTNSLSKIFHFYGNPLSEDMLLGLGAGMGFIYWHQKGMYPFVGARGNNKDFFNDIGKRTSVKIEIRSTASEKKAEEALLAKMEQKEPVMVFGDMGYLPWFDFPKGYHFGGHTFVVCGYDGKDNLLTSDMDPKATGPKKGFYSSITLEQLRKARSSKYKPFPPKNTYLEFDFKKFRFPGKSEIYSAIRQNM
ncbi:MAG: BtrH N-terminal domain-containing protein, partial [Actinobacteria bacterium]|nr:BtrH N-terminal domain-containing protein [Actinomycetota bacterium]